MVTWHFRYILSFILEDFRRADVINDCLSTFLRCILIYVSGESVSDAYQEGNLYNIWG